MQTSESFAQIAAALAAAQGEFPTIPRDRLVRVTMKSGGSYTFRYAPLETILEKTRPALAKNGLALSQSITLDANGAEVLRTTLLHSSGEWMSCEVPIFSGTGDNRSQAYASGVTYSRRYGVTLILCVAADEDDDAEGGDQHEGRPDYVRVPPREKTKPQTPAQRARSGPPKGGRIIDMRGKQQVEDDGDGEGDAGEDASSPYGADLNDPQVKLLRLKAEAAGFSDAELLRHFGVITGETINGVLVKLREAAQ